MDYYGFAELGTEFAKPKLEDYCDGDGDYDYYGYDMAMDQWRSQFPDLRECWCGEPKPVTEPTDTDSTDWLINLLAA